MRSYWLTLVLACVPAIAVADEPINELLKRVPDHANTLLVADVARIFTSPVAVLGNWEKERAKDYETAATGLNPQIRRLVVASEIDATTLAQNWSVTLAESRTPVKLAELANALPGTDDEVAGLPTMVSSRNGFYVALDPNRVGMMTPANRQTLARWLRSASKGAATYSAYLRQAVDRVNKEGEVVIAVDLTDVLDTKGLYRRLSKSPTVTEQKADVDALTKLLVGMKGLTFIVKFDKEITAELRLDFSAPAKALEPLARGIVEESLDQIGLPIAHFDKWQSRAVGNSIVLRGPFDLRGLRQASSFLLSHSSSLNRSTSADKSQPSNSPIEISRRYFRTVNKLVDDLHSEKVKSFNKLAFLFTQYAKKIDELPILNVDPELVSYAGEIASTLRAVSNMTRTEGSRQKTIELTKQDAVVSTPGNYYYGYGVNGYGRPWGYSYQGVNVERYNNYDQVLLMQYASAANEGAVRNDVWRRIDDLTAATRRKMVEKYMVEF